MRTLRTIPEIREAVRAERAQGRRIGLVPTMGALHEGHLSLLRRAARECETVVMSLFVNPTQFAPGEDLAAYPRDEAHDAELAAGAGATLMFAPAPAEIYPPGFATEISVAGVSEPLCGAARGPGHFRGVATVVAKLLNIVGPDVAYFGQKDAQQVAVIRRLVRDLDIPVEIVACPIVREADGLAMSSRNVYLGEEDRRRAVGLSRALAAAERAVDSGEREAGAIARAAREELAEHEIDPEYVELVTPDTLTAVETVDGPVLVALAARVGSARLIDNAVLTPTTGK
jgi:pantoate--beta-alanine ligase